MDKKISQNGDANARRARAAIEMPVLAAIAEKYASQAPMKGERIALCGHITEATSVQVDTLRDLGAEVAWCASSTSTTDEAIRAAMSDSGMFVVGTRGMSEDDLENGVAAVRDFWPEGPTLVIDEGARLIQGFHAADCKIPLPRLAAEKTPEGIHAIEKMHLRFPVLESDFSLGKRLVDNPHGTSQSLITTILNVTQKLLAGKTFLVLGFGRVGSGLAEKARGLGARVIVAETRPTRALIATLSGFEIASCEEALPQADIICTVTGRNGAIRSKHFELLKDGAVLVNGGHSPLEIDVAALKEQGTEKPFSFGINAYTLSNKQVVYLVADGNIANLAVGSGNPNEVMDVTFASQVLALVYAKTRDYEPSLHELPDDSEKAVAKFVAGSMGLDVSYLS